MTKTFEFNGQTVEMKFQERGMLLNCSHWEWILDFVRAGIVVKANRGDLGVPPDFKLP